MRYHWSFDAKDEYDKGREDERWGKHDWEHDKYSSNDKDRAYFEGREDYKREEQERREEERREEERQHHEDYLRHQQEQQQIEDEQEYEPPIPEPEQPTQ